MDGNTCNPCEDHGEAGPFGPSQIQQPVLNISQLNHHTHCNNYCYSHPLAQGKELPKAHTADLPACCGLGHLSPRPDKYPHVLPALRWQLSPEAGENPSLCTGAGQNKNLAQRVSTCWGGWLLCQASSAALAPVPSASRSSHTPPTQQAAAWCRMRTKFCLSQGEGQSPTTVVSLIWMLTYLLQVTSVISHGMQTSDNTGRERGALRLRRKCIFSTSHQANYQLLSFPKSFNYAYSSKSEVVLTFTPLKWHFWPMQRS